VTSPSVVDEGVASVTPAVVATEIDNRIDRLAGLKH
jgi:hypothetical protein